MWAVSALADIPWPEVVQRLKIENERLERRPGGHSGEYFIVCTLYYTPKESGFTFERGFDATRRPRTHRQAADRQRAVDAILQVYGRRASRLAHASDRGHAALA